MRLRPTLIWPWCSAVQVGWRDDWLIEPAKLGDYFAAMHPNEFCKEIIGIESPWHLIDVRVDAPTATVGVVAELRDDPCCPICSNKCAGFDSCQRVFRHLDRCQYKTHQIFDVPLIECEKQGVH